MVHALYWILNYLCLDVIPSEGGLPRVFTGAGNPSRGISVMP
jgi:hypothetical protein